MRVAGSMILVVPLLLLIVGMSSTDEPATSLTDIVSATWAVETDEGKASATLFKSVKDGAWYAITAGHVVERLKEVKEDVKDGQKVSRVVWKDVFLVQKISESIGEEEIEVGSIRLRAKVIDCSPSDEEDVALLKLYALPFPCKGAAVAPASLKIQTGLHVFHVGNLYGELTASLTDGIVSAVGRVIDNTTYLQVTTPAVPGSSGGGVYAEHEGKWYYIGMIVRGSTESSNVNLAVPLSRIRKWLRSIGHAHVIGEVSESKKEGREEKK
ncbi:MAG: serine protease [Thermofilaceae archaeon]